MTALSQAMAWGGTNLLNNAGFETQGSSPNEAYCWESGNPDNHGGTAGSHGRWNWRDHSGSWIMAIMGTWGGVNPNHGTVWQEVPVYPGVSYTAGAWFWADDTWYAASQGFRLKFYNAGGTQLSSITTNITTYSFWRWHSLTATAPPNTAWARLEFFVTGAGTEGAFQFDDAFICETTVDPLPMTRRTCMVFSEIMYHPPKRTDGLNGEFLEICNTEPMAYNISGWKISGDIQFTFPANTTIPGFGCLVVAKNPAAIEGIYGISGVLGPYSGNLPNSSGTLELINRQGAKVVVTEYEDMAPWPVEADGTGHSLVLHDGSYGESDYRSYKASVYLGGNPGRSEYPAPANTEPVINEFLAHTDLPQVDFIELYNPGSSTIDLGGYFLTDNDAAEDAYVIPAGTTLAAGDHVVFDENTLGFQLNSEGDEIYLFNASTTRVVDAVAFGGQKNGQSCGRYPDGGPGFYPLSSVTKNTANAPFQINDVVINEIMFHPIKGGDSDNEYIELYNRSGSPVNISRWRFNDGIEFVIPENTWIPANGYIVVAADAAHLIANYPQLNSGNTIGNYAGSLSHRGERIALVAPDDPADPDDRVRYLVDEVTYCDGGFSRDAADGDGSSLELIDPDSDNRLAMNWRASDETAKSSWISCAVTGVLCHGNLARGTTINQLDLLMMGGAECLVDDVEVIPQGQGNIVANSTFEGGSASWQMRGDHCKSSVTDVDAYSGSRSLHINAQSSGDTRADRVTGNLNTSLYDGQTAVIRLKARWLSGRPWILARLLGNYLEGVFEMPVPLNLGTPGLQNSRYAGNTGPAISEVTHWPAHPVFNEPVKVFARVEDPDGVGPVYLRYRVDPATSFSQVTMTQDATGLFSATLPGQPDKTLAAFHIRATDQNASPATATYPQNLTNNECLVRFDLDQDHEIFPLYTIWMREADMNEWANRSELSNYTLPVTFLCRGRIIYDARIRFRGSAFIRPAYFNPINGTASYRIEFPKDNRFLSSCEFNLDWMEPGRDTTYQRERCAFRIARETGLPTIYQRYVSVCLYGLRRGIIYYDSQHPDSDFIESWYPDDDDRGELYKINDWYEFDYNLDLWNHSRTYRDANLVKYAHDGEIVKRRYRWSWMRKKIGDFSDDYSSLLTLVEAANLSGENYTKALESVCDVKQWMTTTALRHALSDYDSFGYIRGKNMFTFRPGNGRFQLINWDIDFGMGCDNNWDTTKDVFEIAPVFPAVSNMMFHPPFMRYYCKALNDLITGPMLASSMDTMLDETYNALDANGTIIDKPSTLKTWFSERRDYISGKLNGLTNAPFNITQSSITASSNMITLSGTAPVQDAVIKVNGKPAEFTWTSPTAWSFTLVVTAGVSTITMQGCDENGNALAGHSDAVQITCSGLEDAIENSIVINEIMYNPLLDRTGFIELFNKSETTAFDLYNCKLEGVDLIFDKATVIQPGQHLIVAADPLKFVQYYGPDTPVAAQWPGTLDPNGEWLRLRKLNALGQPVLLIDEAYCSNHAPWPEEAAGLGSSLQLIDADEDNTRVGNWAADTVTPFTPGEVNSVADDLPAFPAVRINEVQPHNASTMSDGNGEPDPWFELYNPGSNSFACSNYYLTDDFSTPFKWALPAIHIPATDFQLIWADSGTSIGTEYHTSFTLNPEGGNLALVRDVDGTPVIVDYCNYSAISEDHSFGCFPDATWTNRIPFSYPTPGSANNNATAPAKIYINEWLADNDNGIIDPATGNPADWFEIYNAEEHAVDLNGFSLTDNPSIPNMWIISEPVILQPKEFRLVWADDKPSANQWGTNTLHAGFKLSKDGDNIALFSPGGTLIDILSFKEQTTDISEGRYPDGATKFYEQGATTPGSPNVLDPNLLNISASCTGGGNISPFGNTPVQIGNDLVFTITADPFYFISDIRTNGVSTGGPFGSTNLTFNWNNITRSGSIHVQFAPIETTHGTPHYWLAEYGLIGNWDARSAADQDGDGMPTWQEYLAGTNPTNSESIFSTDGEKDHDSNGFVLSWPSASNRYYTICRMASLSESPVIIYNRMPATPPMNVYTDLLAEADSAFYYWIKVED